MQVIIEDCKIPVRTLDCPVCHVLPGNIQSIPRKLLLLPVKRHRIDIFGIHYGRLQRRGHQAAPQQCFRMRGLYDLIRLFASIYFYMVFLYFHFCRGKGIPAVNLIREFFPSIFPKIFIQFLFVHGMFHSHNRYTPQVFLTFPFFLPGFRLRYVIRFLILLIPGIPSNGFRLVKKIRSSRQSP